MSNIERRLQHIFGKSALHDDIGVISLDDKSAYQQITTNCERDFLKTVKSHRTVIFVLALVVLGSAIFRTEDTEMQIALGFILGYVVCTWHMMNVEIWRNIYNVTRYHRSLLLTKQIHNAIREDLIESGASEQEGSDYSKSISLRAMKRVIELSKD